MSTKLNSDDNDDVIDSVFDKNYNDWYIRNTKDRG